MMKFRVTYVSIFVAALGACDRQSEIKVYRVSKAPLEEEADDQRNAMPANAPSPSMPGGMAPVVSAVSVSVPPNWEPQPPSQMRQASFLVKGANGVMADISLVSLNAAAGNVLENVNRWLSQLGQPPIDEGKLRRITQRLPTKIGDVTVVDLTGLSQGAGSATDGRIIAAMVSNQGSTLFFKMRGNAELTELQKSDFLKWITAVCNSQNTGQISQTAAMPSVAAGNLQIKWKVPPGWTEMPPSAMRYASFSADSNNGKIDISIVTFAGEGGSDTDNVNRWREQLGLPPMSQAAVATQVTPLQAGDVPFSTIDIAGASARTLAAWTRREGHVWFFKATGPSAVVETQKSNFVKFVQSVRF
jgi:hypothetical protein